jgi:hypothetical protein
MGHSVGGIIRHSETYNPSIIAARAAGTDEALGIASWAFVGILRLWQHIGGFLMHAEVFWRLSAFCMFDSHFDEIPLWLSKEDESFPRNNSRICTHVWGQCDWQ